MKGLALGLLLAVGCASTAPASEPACAIDDEAPAVVIGVCGNSQFVVMRCDGPIGNPGGIECKATADASVWCCK